MATLPSDLKYTKEHEWLRDNGDGTATIGITDFAQGELGDIVFVELAEAGTSLDQEESFGTIEAVKTVSELYMPISGSIEKINTDLEDDPELVNKDPYGDGWLVVVRIADASQIDGLMDNQAYQEIIA